MPCVADTWRARNTPSLRARRSRGGRPVADQSPCLCLCAVAHINHFNAFSARRPREGKCDHTRLVTIALNMCVIRRRARAEYQRKVENDPEIIAVISTKTL